MIKLQRIEIQKFGKLTAAVFSLSTEMQVFYGENSAGKSTLQLFIKTMFYGIARRGGREAVKERERVLPWTGGNAGGSLYLEKDGQKLVITRTFGQRPAEDRIQVFDETTGERIPALEKENCGEQLLGMSEKMFCRTLYVGQQEIAMAGKDEELQNTMLRLMTDGTEDFFFSDAQKTLAQEHKRLKAETKRERPGIIDQKNEELLALRREIYMAASMNKQRQQERQKLQAQKQALEKEEADYQALSEKQRAADAARLVQSLENVKKWKEKIRQILSAPELKRLQGISSAEAEQLFALENQILALDPSARIGYDKEEKFFAGKKFWIAGFVVGCVLFLVALLVFFLGETMMGTVLGGLSLFSFVLWGIAGYRFGDTSKKRAEKPENITAYQNLLEQREKILQKWQMKSTAEFRTAYYAYVQLQKELDTCRSVCETALGKRTFLELQQQAKEAASWIRPDVSADDHFEDEILRQREKCRKLRQAVLDAEQKSGYEVYHDLDTGMLAGRADMLQNEIDRLQLRYQAVCLAEEKIQEVYQKFQSDYTPVLREKMQPFLERLTDGAELSLRISDEFRVRFCRDGIFHKGESLSCGLYDGLYLALRLALASVLGHSFLCMDDVLANLDDRRAADMAKELMKYADRDGIQVILFTCHRRDMEHFMRLGSKVKNLEGGARNGSGDKK